MCNSRVLLILCVIACWIEPLQAEPKDKPPAAAEVDAVRAHLQWRRPEEFTASLKELDKMGVKKVFPALEAILAKPKTANELANVFAVLRELKGDRKRFLDRTLRALAHSQPEVKLAAANLLAEIATPREASPLVALLSDADERAVAIAAKTLSVIGGPREVVALDAWLLGVSHKDSQKLREQVKQHRDELKKRLEKVAPKKKDS